jgi:hypothetical protein
MSLLSTLDRRFGHLGIPRVTLYIVLGQAFFYVAQFARPDVIPRIQLIPDRVLAGEWWRLLTFIVSPPMTNPIFAFFGLYLFWLMGSALEQQWGAFRYNVYLLIAYVATIATAFFFPSFPATNTYVETTVFLAFATLFPNFEILLFFILPVKVKWLGLLTGLFFAYSAVTGPWPVRAAILAGVSNYLLFFARDIVDGMRSGKKRMDHRARFAGQSFAPEPDAATARHTCTTCGITDVTHPRMDFRYCDLCDGHHGYCESHAKNHEHKRATQPNA